MSPCSDWRPVEYVVTVVGTVEQAVDIVRPESTSGARLSASETLSLHGCLLRRVAVDDAEEEVRVTRGTPSFAVIATEPRSFELARGRGSSNSWARLRRGACVWSCDVCKGSCCQLPKHRCPSKIAGAGWLSRRTGSIIHEIEYMRKPIPGVG